ncbi:MAG: pantothenate kinase [Cyanobacteria bacterium P01_C01_bin.72]
MKREDNWLALAVGNSRLHWAWFRRHTLVATWDTHHLSISVQPNQLPHLFLHSDLVRQGFDSLSVYLASVVSKQSECWQYYEYLISISLKDINLTDTYPTMGVDRALAISGAISSYQQACLVVDGGTALTFTGVDADGKFIGGAILPGLRSQLLALQQKTSALPEVPVPNRLPARWGMDTDTAIASGVLYTAIAGIQSYIVDWLRQFPQSQIIFTGGDGEILSRFLQQQYPDLASEIIVDHNLVFQGIKLVYQQQANPQSNCFFKDDFH